MINIAEDIIKQYTSEFTDEGGGTICYDFYPYIYKDELIRLLWKAHFQMEELKEKLGNMTI